MVSLLFEIITWNIQFVSTLNHIECSDSTRTPHSSGPFMNSQVVILCNAYLSVLIDCYIEHLKPHWSLELYCVCKLKGGHIFTNREHVYYQLIGTIYILFTTFEQLSENIYLYMYSELVAVHVFKGTIWKVDTFIRVWIARGFQDVQYKRYCLF